MAKRTTMLVDEGVVQRAMGALGVDVPVRAWRVKGRRLLLVLATGEEVVWDLGKGGKGKRQLAGGRGADEGEKQEVV